MGRGAITNQRWSEGVRDRLWPFRIPKGCRSSTCFAVIPSAANCILVIDWLIGPKPHFTARLRINVAGHKLQKQPRGALGVFTGRFEDDGLQTGGQRPLEASSRQLAQTNPENRWEIAEKRKNKEKTDLY